MNRIVSCIAAGLLGLAAPLAAQASLSSLSSLFVFGDSLSDGGNSGLLTQAAAGVVFPPPPYYNGQYSNGPVAVEYLWQSFNPGDSSFKPSLAGGTNYAIAGATTGTVNYNSVNPNVPAPLRPAFDQRGSAWQLQAFAAQAPVFDPATSLFVVWQFPNDVFYASQTDQLPGTVPGSPGGANLVTNGIQNILATVAALYASGARHFLVPNMPDLGSLPFSIGTAQAPTLTGITGLFNAGLDFGLDQLTPALLGADIMRFDTAAFFHGVQANPAAYGFTVGDKACLDAAVPSVCADPNQYVFWDGVHPTTRGHQVLAEQFRATVVPAPQTWALLLLGLGAIGAMARRRAAGLWARPARARG